MGKTGSATTRWWRRLAVVLALVVGAVGWLGACCVPGVLGGRPRERQCTLVVEGRPACTIVLARTPTKAARIAAWELQQHVKLITGATLPITDDAIPVAGPAILVGESAATRKLGLANDDFGDQEYLIRFVRNGLVLMGRDAEDRGELKLDYVADPMGIGTWPSLFDAQGTMYAVYDFLRDYCGVRWLNPTDFGTVAPKRRTLTVSGATRRRQPAMVYRGGSAGNDCAERLQWGGGLWRRGTPEGEKYMQMAYARLYARQSNAHRRMLGVRAQSRLFMYRMKAGGDKAPANHAFYPYYERFWERGHKHFERHRPDYFAKGYEGKKPPQMCYTNEAFIQQLVTDIRDYFDHGGYTKRYCTVASPGYKWGRNYFALEPMDNAAFCKCPECSRQYELDRPRTDQHSTYWFRFVNRVAREIKKSHPDKKILTLAYMTHEGLPTGVRLEDNVVVYFCLSWNRMPYNTQGLAAQFRRLEEWSAKGGVPLYLWLYHCFPRERADRLGKWYCFPGFFAHELGRQFARYHQLGVRGIFHCGFNGEVENYLSYRLMDDPTLDVQRLLDDYFAHYGAAAPAIRAFYRLVEQRYCDPALYPKAKGGGTWGHQTERVAWNHLGTQPVMERLAAHLAQAHTLARTDLERTRVRLWDQAVWQYMKAGAHQTTPVERLAIWKGHPGTLERILGAEPALTPGNALAGKPFVSETPGTYFNTDVPKRVSTRGTCAAFTNGKLETTFIHTAKPKPIHLRCDLGPVAAAGRELRRFRVIWSHRDAARCHLGLQLFVRDAATQKWRAVSKVHEYDKWQAIEGFMVLTLPFPKGGVTGFDAIRVAETVTLRKRPSTRFCEFEAEIVPASK